MDGQHINTVMGLLIALVGFCAWSVVLRIDPDHPFSSRVMWGLALGMLLVSSLALAEVSWWVGVVASANRAIVAGAGLRALWLLRAGAAHREP